MEPQQESSKTWKNTQVYGFCAVCLVVGIIVGFLIHGPSEPARVAPQLQAQQVQEGVMPAPTPEQMKHMGDKMAEPILAELQRDPNNPELLAKAGAVYLRAAQFGIAIEYYDKSIKAKPAAETYVSLSNAYHFAGEDDKAIAALQQAVALDPKSANALFNLGMLSLKYKHDPKAAIAYWQKLLKTNPNHPKRAQVEALIAKAKQQIELASIK